MLNQKIMKKLLYGSALVLALVPFVAAAQNQLETFVTQTIGGTVNALVTVLVAIATLVFIFGIVKYISAAGDPEKMKTARSYIIFSIIALALILGIWGVAQFLLEGTGLNTYTPDRIPGPTNTI